MRDIDFVGSDSSKERCPAVFRDKLTGGFYQVGRHITDPDVLAGVREHVSIAPDEAVVWQPGSLADVLAEAAAGTYDEGRIGHAGTSTFAELLADTQRSAVHLEMRDVYEPDNPDYKNWLKGGPAIGDDDWSDWCELIGSAVKRGVRVRRARVVSVPPTDYIRWEHAITTMNIKAGEEVRWLPRRQTWDLPLPGADFWMFDQKLVRFHFDAGDGTPIENEYEYVSDPRQVAPVVAAFEMVWERAISHDDFKM
jgi:hypothetical protein